MSTSLSLAEKIYYLLDKNKIQTNCERKELGFHNYFHIIGDYIQNHKYDNLQVLEIGSFKGYSAVFFALHKKVQFVDCVDFCQFTDQDKEFFHNIGNLSKKIFLHKCLSSQFKPVKKYDIIFIDGSHAYNDVIEDFKLANSVLNPGGFIFFDDYSDSKYSPEVKLAVDDMIKNNTINPFIYRVIGCPKNTSNAYDFTTKIPEQFSNLFILEKKH